MMQMILIGDRYYKGEYGVERSFCGNIEVFRLVDMIMEVFSWTASCNVEYMIIITEIGISK